MNCHMHPATPATATCQICGRGLCSPCSARFTPLRCQHCIVQGSTAAARDSYTALAITGISFLAAFYLTGSLIAGNPMLRQQPQTHVILTRIVIGLQLSFTYLIYTFICAHMPFSGGRRRRNGNSNVFIAVSLAFWPAYFMLKVFLAAMIALSPMCFLLAPYLLFKLVRQLQNAQRAKRQFAQG
jgi:uncharacterized membrane protein